MTCIGRHTKETIQHGKVISLKKSAFAMRHIFSEQAFNFQNEGKKWRDFFSFHVALHSIICFGMHTSFSC